MLRTSSYTIYVDLPDDAEQMLLVHGYTGAHDLVSRRVATYLRSRESRRAPRPLYGNWTPEPPVDGDVASPSDETLEILRRRGYLTPLSSDQEEDLFTRIVGKIHANHLRLAPGYVLMPTYDCNLRCPYCFQDPLRSEAGQRRKLRLMSRATADRIFRAMTVLEEHHEVEDPAAVTRNITFFGGEPLLARSRPILEYIVQRVLEMGKARFSAVSNATELAAYRGLIGPELIADIQITLDGPPREHDRRRMYPDARGSFEVIAENITMALELGAHINVRTNVDRQNIGDLPELADEMVRRGWSESERFTAYVSPIRAGNETTDERSTLSLWDLNRELAKLAAEHDKVRILRSADEPTRRLAQRIFSREGLSYPTMKSSFCGAHTAMYVFDALGDIYSCWERTGEPGIRLGRLDGNGSVQLDPDIVQTWRTRTVAANPACRACRYALYCGGGCASQAMTRSGTYFQNYCDGFRNRFRASVAEAYTAYLAGDEARQAQLRTCDI